MNVDIAWFSMFGSKKTRCLHILTPATSLSKSNTPKEPQRIVRGCKLEVYRDWQCRGCVFIGWCEFVAGRSGAVGDGVRVWPGETAGAAREDVHGEIGEGVAHDAVDDGDAGAAADGVVTEFCAISRCVEVVRQG